MAQWIQGVTVSGVTQTSAVVGWSTCSPASSSVSFGTTASYGTVVGSATLSATHSVMLSNLTPGTLYHLAVSDADSTGTIVSGKDLTFTTSVPPPPPPPPLSTVTLWSASTVPGTKDGGATSSIELGTQIKSDVAGQITALRFYKATTNTGTHIGNIWSSTGTRLATVTFTNETASGWQEQALTTPVQVVAGTLYVVSYHTVVGHFAYDLNYFTAQYNAAPLHVPANGGVYNYGTNTSTFPSTTVSAVNLWVDVRFQPSQTVPPPPTQHTVSLTWGASPTQDVTKYNIYREISGGTFTVLSSVNAPALAFTDSSVASGSTYVYRLTAVDPSGESMPSSSVTEVIPTP